MVLELLEVPTTHAKDVHSGVLPLGGSRIAYVD
jgi:hypothetical protein